jgi:hypothetical protein
MREYRRGAGPVQKWFYLQLFMDLRPANSRFFGKFAWKRAPQASGRRAMPPGMPAESVSATLSRTASEKCFTPFGVLL